MGCISKVAGQNTLRRIQQIQAITIVWMSVEAGVSLAAAWAARSPALLALGGDSAVELLSATVVLWRFRTNLAQGRAERNAARVEGALLFALTAYVIAVSAMSLLGQNPPRPSHVGIGILIAAAIVMPWLAKAKQKLSAATGSAALRADTAQSGFVCLSFADCPVGTRGERDLAYCLGRPNCCVSGHAPHVVGRQKKRCVERRAAVADAPAELTCCLTPRDS
jgi:hypothetical protein